MSAVNLQMACVAGLLGLAVLAIVLSRSKAATAVIYGATLAVSAIALIGSMRSLLGDPANVTAVTLPVGLPWLGARFRVDALASFFLIVVNSEGPRRAFMVSATATTKRRRTACFRFFLPFWRA
jgi:hydrogenase-4 component B